MKKAGAHRMPDSTDVLVAMPPWPKAFTLSFLAALSLWLASPSATAAEPVRTEPQVRDRGARTLRRSKIEREGDATTRQLIRACRRIENSLIAGKCIDRELEDIESYRKNFEEIKEKTLKQMAALRAGMVERKVPQQTLDRLDVQQKEIKERLETLSARLASVVACRDNQEELRKAVRELAAWLEKISVPPPSRSGADAPAHSRATDTLSLPFIYSLEGCALSQPALHPPAIPRPLEGCAPARPCVADDREVVPPPASGRYYRSGTLPLFSAADTRSSLRSPSANSTLPLPSHRVHRVHRFFLALFITSASSVSSVRNIFLLPIQRDRFPAPLLDHWTFRAGYWIFKSSFSSARLRSPSAKSISLAGIRSIRFTRSESAYHFRLDTLFPEDCGAIPGVRRFRAAFPREARSCRRAGIPACIVQPGATLFQGLQARYPTAQGSALGKRELSCHQGLKARDNQEMKT